MTIEVDVAHRLGAFALDVRFTSEGRLTAFFGQSGAGKTSLVNVIGGLIHPDRGRIAVDGTTLVDTASGTFVPTHRRRVGYVFQEGRLFPHLTVRQNLMLGVGSGRRRSARFNSKRFLIFSASATFCNVGRAHCRAARSSGLQSAGRSLPRRACS